MCVAETSGLRFIVLLELNIGDVVIDLHTSYAPKACENFLKLCKVKYYNFSPIYNVQKDFSFQTGDPLGGSTGTGGDSIWGLISKNPNKYRWFAPEIHPKLKHAERGTVSMVCRQTGNDEPGLATSKFFITLGDNIDYLDGKHAIFGRVAEGFDVLEQISNALCDDEGLPYRDIRIKHTIVLEDPYPDPPGLVEPPSSPLPTKAQLATMRISEAEEHADDNLTEEEIARRKRAQQARTEALTLEMVGDLPFAEVAPPENILFVCKLNRATRDEDLELIFSRFGKILSCEIIKDKRTGDSLQYAFIEFTEKKDCEQAYFKMEGV